MTTFIQLGCVQSNAVAQAGSINFGANIVQNRNTTKQNVGNYIIFEGLGSVKTNKFINIDPDYLDNASFDGNNYVGTQL
ncbi:hypothetical protein MK805_17180 [Shimazuella sp. AN120528]|uniref:hypothetical protein n=1 Tax=Shimazuella soli TaxID=1892854 RepID=UPI001F0F8E9E|nr:hypothetical protein [Shimazuella soli]MCH5586671.1 hypothetical protein [Shimazuella soli]